MRALRRLGRNPIARAAAVAGAAGLAWLAFKSPTLSNQEARLVWLSGVRPLFSGAGRARSGFGDRMIVPPEFSTLTRNPHFDSRKEKGVFRIVCIGGSTTVGWPFHRASYPAFLSALLRDVLPDRKIEVINAGFESSDSRADALLLEQVLDFEPDLLLIYEGRNDRWNLPLHVGWRSAVFRLHCRLMAGTNVYAQMHRLVFRALGVKNYDEAARSWASVSGRTSEAEVRSFLLGNLVRMTTAATRRRGCSMVMLTQVTSPEEMSLNLEIFKINDWIRKFAAEHGLPVSDVGREFQKRWGQAAKLVIPTPTVHPDVDGYILMARTVARTLAENGLIAPKPNWRLYRARSDAEYVRILGVDDAELNEVYTLLGGFFIDRGLPEIGRRYLERAQRMRPGLRAVP